MLNSILHKCLAIFLLTRTIIRLSDVWTYVVQHENGNKHIVSILRPESHRCPQLHMSTNQPVKRIEKIYSQSDASFALSWTERFQNKPRSLDLPTPRTSDLNENHSGYELYRNDLRVSLRTPSTNPMTSDLEESHSGYKLYRT